MERGLQEVSEIGGIWGNVSQWGACQVGSSRSGVDGSRVRTRTEPGNGGLSCCSQFSEHVCLPLCVGGVNRSIRDRRYTKPAVPDSSDPRSQAL